jgi:ArsR family transcriptional regulator
MSPRPDPPQLLARLTTLADAARLRILRLLDAHELSVGELAAALQLPQSTVSRQLKVLHEAGWILKRSEGTASLYYLSERALEDEARALWEVARTQIGTGPTIEEDDSRLREVLAERRRESRSFFGQLGGDWDRVREELFGLGFTTEALLGLIAQDWMVADLGCGTGNGAALLAPFVGRIVAVDREPTMLEAARKRLRDVDNVEFIEGELDALPLENEQFDAAMFFLVLHHQPDPTPALTEAARIVRPGGVILVVDMVAHDRENYRHTMGHQHLGFDEETVATWAANAGLSPPRYRRLHPDTQSKGPGLFAATMWKPA